MAFPGGAVFDRNEEFVGTLANAFYAPDGSDDLQWFLVATDDGHRLVPCAGADVGEGRRHTVAFDLSMILSAPHAASDGPAPSPGLEAALYRHYLPNPNS